MTGTYSLTVACRDRPHATPSSHHTYSPRSPNRADGCHPQYSAHAVTSLSPRPSSDSSTRPNGTGGSGGAGSVSQAGGGGLPDRSVARTVMPIA